MNNTVVDRKHRMIIKPSTGWVGSRNMIVYPQLLKQHGSGMRSRGKLKVRKWQVKSEKKRKQTVVSVICELLT